MTSTAGNEGTANPLLEAALAYVRKIKVFPVHNIDAAGRCSCGSADCASPGKHPRPTHGHLEATDDPEIIRKWWKRWPKANIAMACGASGRVVIDVDERDGRPGLDTWFALKQELGLELEDTALVETPSGGLHIHYLAAGPNVGCGNDLLGSGIDVKGAGGYVLLPPSAIGGVEYAWVNGHDLEQTTSISQALAARLEFVARGAGRRGEQIDVGREIREGRRNGTLFRDACAMRRRDHTRPEIQAAISKTNERCVPPLRAMEVRRIVDSAMKYEPEQHAVTRPGGNPCNDDGNAERLIEAFGDRIRYCDELNAWLIYDGLCWRQDRVREVEDLAGRALRGIGREAAETADGGEHRALLHWALRSGDMARCRAAIAKACSDERVRIRACDLNSDPWLLNVLNGTVDLRTASLRAHDSGDLISKLAPVAYDPHARSDVLDRVLRQATDGDETLARYLQLAAGYSLTGLTTEEVFFLLYGPEATAKSTLTESLMAMLGDYAKPANAELFLARDRVGGPREELVSLDGARMIVIAEFERGRRMNEALLKQLTGGDTVSARGNYEHERAFAFTGKLWFHTNFIPAMSDDDGSVWRRARIVPFENVVPPQKRDAAVKATLRDPALSGAAILAWATQGCSAWQHEKGLGEARAIEKATRAVREAMDPLADFFQESCRFEPGCWTGNPDLKMAHLAWVRDGRGPKISDKEWGVRLRKRGAEPSKRNGVRGWLGIRLLDAEAVECTLGRDAEGH